MDSSCISELSDPVILDPEWTATVEGIAVVEDSSLVSSWMSDVEEAGGASRWSPTVSQCEVVLVRTWPLHSHGCSGPQQNDLGEFSAEADGVIGDLAQPQ